MEQQYRVLLASVCLVMIKFSIDTVFGRILIELQDAFPGAKASVLMLAGSLLQTLQALLTLLVLLMTTVLNHTQTLLLGIGISSLGYILTSLVQNEYQLIISYGVLAGWGGSLIIRGSVFLIADYFPPTHRFHVFSTSLVMTLYPLAIATVSISNEFLYYVTWREMYVIYTGLLCFAGLVVKVILSGHNTTETAPLRPTTNVTLINNDIRLPSILLVAMNMFLSMFIKLPVYILTAYTHSMGNSIGHNSNTLLYFGLSEFASRMLAAILGDRFIKGRFLLLYTVCCTVMAALNGWFVIVGGKQYWQNVTYTVLAGFLGGPLISGQYAICSEVGHIDSIKALYSLNTTIRALGYMLGPIITGVLYDLTGSYLHSFTLMLVVQLLAALCSLTIIICKTI